jgi:hypothetical protein
MHAPVLKFSCSESFDLEYLHISSYIFIYTDGFAYISFCRSESAAIFPA